MEKVKEAVTETFGSVNPREDMSQEKLSELTLVVRRKVEGATSEERRYVVLPTSPRGSCS
jgi:peroxin-3